MYAEEMRALILETADALVHNDDCGRIEKLKLELTIVLSKKPLASENSNQYVHDIRTLCLGKTLTLNIEIKQESTTTMK
jgi:hypothetical protein